MMKKCHKCGMVRSTKDLVLSEEGDYICFSCWNKINRDKREKT